MSKGNNCFLGAYLWSTLIQNKGWGPSSAKQRKQPPREAWREGSGLRGQGQQGWTRSTGLAVSWTTPASSTKRPWLTAKTREASGPGLQAGHQVCPLHLGVRGRIFPSILDALGFVLPWMNSSQHSYCPCNTGLCERRSASSGRHYPVPPPSDFCLQCPSGVFPLCLFPLGLFCPSPNFFSVTLCRLHLPPAPVRLCHLMKLVG